MGFIILRQSWNQSPVDTEEQLSIFWGSQSYTQILYCMREFGAPNPRVAQGSTVWARRIVTTEIKE